MITYALILAGDLLAAHASPAKALLLARLYWPLLFFPALFWFGAISSRRLPEDTPLYTAFQKTFNLGLLLVIPLYIFSAAGNLIFDFRQIPPRPGTLYFVFVTAVLLPMLAALLTTIWLFKSTQPKRPLGFLLLATLFFGLSAVLFVLPFNWPAPTWFLLGVSVDFVLLGLTIALLDALDEGESLRLDLLRAFSAYLLAVGMFGGVVMLTIALETGVTFTMLVLLATIITVAIFSQTFTDPIQSALDQLVFSRLPSLRKTRADLRNIAGALPRLNSTIKLDQLDDEEFARLTRQALSNMGNLPKIVSNPLTRLPVIDDRLAKRNAAHNSLERAAELKTLLTESIVRLKPRHKGDFGTSEEWRYFNALYFPYVVGIKPYSRRAEHNGLDPAAREALEWFRTYIPERTLYNWQTAAAKLVAQDLREKM
ncbi:hypothetical protein ACFLXQ_02550 [Chloroflexota bacterium]